MQMVTLLKGYHYRNRLVGFRQVRYHGSVPPRFLFHRGSLALDFVGTVGKRGSLREDRLDDARALTAWLREAGLTERGSAATEADLADARLLREAIARAATAFVGGSRPARGDLATINARAGDALLGRPELSYTTLRKRWHTDAPIRFALGRIAADAVDVLASSRDRLVCCELPSCGCLLLSHSRGPKRRWCTMEGCGNVAKVAAHRARVRARR
jgi:predicted RNA-binding Zn ribbon-like protein